jgi:hypothetical protein
MRGSNALAVKWTFPGVKSLILSRPLKLLVVGLGYKRRDSKGGFEFLLLL